MKQMKSALLPPSKTLSVKQVEHVQSLKATVHGAFLIKTFFCAIILPLFSPKYRVCCAVLDHCRDELSFSATWQVSLTVPPADTVSSEVTGCKGSSPG